MLSNSPGALNHGASIPTTPGRSAHPRLKRQPMSIGRTPGATSAHGNPFGSLATGGTSSGVLSQPGLESTAVNLQQSVSNSVGGGGALPNFNLLRRAGYGGLPFA